MVRCLCWLLAGSAIACFSEEGSSTGAGTDSAGTSAASTGSTTDATTVGTTTTDDTATTVGTMTATTTADTSTGVTTGPDTFCDWPLDWSTTEVKDVLVLVHNEPANLGSLLSTAQSEASADGVHIAVASACPLNCGDPANGYEHHALPAGPDPLAQAAAVVVSRGFFRPHVPQHVVIVTEDDTGWTQEMFDADPRLGMAQLHVRIPRVGSCGDTPVLDGLALSAQGSSTCGDFLGVDVLDAPVLGAQPACELFGDPGAGPGPDAGAALMVLDGTLDDAPVMLMPDGPAVCANAPAAWSIVEVLLGHLSLCPIACRDVGRWAPEGRMATIEFPC